MKKIISALMGIVCIFALAACGSSKPVVIGINQYGEHASLDNCRIGFIQGLENAGLVEGKDFTLEYQNAGFDNNIAIQIAGNFSSNNVDLMCAIATPSATACYAAAEDKNIPVVFVAITDPEAAGLTSGGITGVSDKLAVADQLSLISTLQPDAKTVGIVYTLSEPNSVSAIAEYESLAANYGLTINAIGVTAQSEVTQAVDTLISGGVDCFSNLTDNNVVGVLPSILEKTNEAGIPVYGSEIEQVKIGCVASVGIDYVILGEQSGAMAAAILKGDKKVDDIPYETIAEYSIYINSASLEEMNITLPDDVQSKAIEVAAE